MSMPRGKYLSLSLARRMIGDFLHFSQSIPLAHGERRFELQELREAVALCRPRPSWMAIFFKAYACVSANRPVLRRMYMKYPWPRLYEHPENIGSLVISRQVDGDEGLLYLPVPTPEKMPLTELDALITQARQLPVAQVPAFRRQVRYARLPGPLRRALYAGVFHWSGRWRTRYLGTFGMSVLASMGIANISTWVPWTSMLHYTPFAADGSLHVRIAIDHRVFDGLEAALALQELDQILNGPILDEVKALRKNRAA